MSSLVEWEASRRRTDRPHLAPCATATKPAATPVTTSLHSEVLRTGGEVRAGGGACRSRRSGLSTRRRGHNGPFRCGSIRHLTVTTVPAGRSRRDGKSS
ncbi:hypothetical protein ADL27_33980 [Streptomyces sp. NRRL F-6602]|nr:hypothetical protein ADL27_33980 [Streptomyces sp. NRRL F-6602]